MSGPPIVLFLTNEGYPKNRFKANLVLYGIITNIVAMINFFFGKLINLEVIKLTGFLLGNGSSSAPSPWFDDHQTY